MTCSIKDALLNSTFFTSFNASFILRFPKFLFFFFLVIFEYTHSDNLTIEADSDKLSRVFNNLLKNAINYSSDGTDITVKSFKKNNEVIVEVTNKGKQIPKEKLDRIFEKFYRLDYARTSKTGGSGLGLAIAKEIVELHNGTIKAVSNKEETKFIVTLPIE
mgnify:CR=1 FL=1